MRNNTIQFINASLLIIGSEYCIVTAAWLAQLGERRTAVREVEGSSPRPDQHSGS